MSKTILINLISYVKPTGSILALAENMARFLKGHGGQLDVNVMKWHDKRFVPTSSCPLSAPVSKSVT